MLRICIAGATGWAGSALARAVAQADDLELVAAVSRSHAGKALGEALGEPGLDAPVFSSVVEALELPCDVFVEYTKPDAARTNISAALERGVHVVVGTSGLTDETYSDLGQKAREQGLGLLAVGNFALAPALLQKFATVAAKYLPNWEIFDYSPSEKVDAPSGTARELASRLSPQAKALAVPVEQVQGFKEARGATVAGTQVHSVRLPGYATVSTEIVFGLPDERLSIRHDAGSSATPYVAGALLAIRGVSRLRGLHRGLEHVLEL